MQSSDNPPLLLAARSSPLSQAQFIELQQMLPHLNLHPLWVETRGDRDLLTSLRELDKSDFFTRDIDQLLLKGHCRLALHSAKDLPDPLPEGLELLALTRCLDSRDALVIREESLPSSPLIATSSLRREENVRLLIPDARFCDIRGTIGQRLEQLETRKLDGVVIAEAALLRLGLKTLQRLYLPGETTPLQGQLAVVSRSGDEEMEQLFTPIDQRALCAL